MIGLTAFIFIYIPETPWWLVSKGKIDQTMKVLRRCNGNVEGYDIPEQIVSLIQMFFHVVSLRILIQIDRKL